MTLRFYLVNGNLRLVSQNIKRTPGSRLCFFRRNNSTLGNIPTSDTMHNVSHLNEIPISELEPKKLSLRAKELKVVQTVFIPPSPLCILSDRISTLLLSAVRCNLSDRFLG